MALILKNYFQQSDDKLTVSVWDGTGTYNSGSNPGGYGGVNPVVADFVSCSIDIYFPDSTTLMPQSTIGATIDAYSTLPNTNGTAFVIDSVAVFGSSQAWATGWYRFVVTQETSTDPPAVATSDNLIPIFRSTDCCIDDLIVSADLCGCEGKDHSDLNIARAGLDELWVEDRSTGDLSVIESCEPPLYNKGAEIMINAMAVCAADGCNPCSDC